MRDLFRIEKTTWIEKARNAARDLLKTRPSITIEDVLEVCPLPKYLHRNTIGSVFNKKEFDAVGFAYSRRAVSHGRLIRKWGVKTVRRTQRAFIYDEVM